MHPDGTSGCAARGHPFQRKLLLSLHKEGKFSDTAIRQVAREMDIGELSFRQLLPKTGP